MFDVDCFMKEYRSIESTYTLIKNYLPTCQNTTESLDIFLSKLADVEEYLESSDSSLLFLLKLAAELKLDIYISNRLPVTDTFQQFKIALIFYRITYQI